MATSTSSPKLRRERDQRRALVKNLANSIIEKGSVETTLIRAKMIRPYVEKLVTKAKKGDLHNRRQIISALTTLDAVDRLFDEIVPSTKNRTSGYLRIKRTGLRRGDLAQMAEISFVDEIVAAKKAEPAKKAEKPAEESKKTDAKPKATKETTK